ALVVRAGVERDLAVLRLGDVEAAVDGRRRRSPVLVELEADGPGRDLIDQPLRTRAVALAGEPHVQRHVVDSLEHPRDVPDAGRAGGRVGPGGRTRPAAEPGGDAAGQRLVGLLRTDEVDVAVDPSGGQDVPLAG